jgi:conjugal transfer pilus assembly protein TraW
MKSFLCLLILLFVSNAQAKDYGVFGKTYVIAEQDFLLYIQQKIQTMQTNGQWANLQEQFSKQVKAHLTRPGPINIPKATENRQFIYDPTFDAPHDVTDIKGNLIVKKGTRINPLERVQLHSVLIFFNGDDKDQINWAKNELENNKQVKLILTSGSLKTTTNYFKQAIYFDLNGYLVGKFEIRALPAKVQQIGKRLEISEVAL